MTKRNAKLVSFVKESLFSGRFILFLVCLFFSILFWVITEFNRTGIHRLSIPVKFTNIPSDKSLLGELPKNIELEVKGSGIRLFLLSLKKFREPFIINLGGLKKVRENAYLIGAGNLSDLSGGFFQEVEIIKLSPDLVFFTNGKVYSKKIVVKPNVTIESELNNGLSVISKCSPGVITLSGDSNVIKIIDTIFTEKIVIDQLGNNLSQKAGLVFPDGIGENIFSSHNSVQLEILVEKLTESSFEVPVNVVNLPSGMKIRLFPERVKVTCQVGIKQFDKIDQSYFQAFVDFNEYKPGKNYLRIKMNKQQQGVLKLNIFPEKTEFLIQK